ncbi:MAG: hypothetical protein R3Y36_01315 [Spirochaetales bacterium]
MKRLEIIFSQAIDDDFIDACAEKKIGQYFTKIQNVRGQGYSVPKMGDNIWPQLNNQYIIYCENAEAEEIHTVIIDLRKKYPTEGIAFFVSDGEFSQL